MDKFVTRLAGPRPTPEPPSPIQPAKRQKFDKDPSNDDNWEVSSDDSVASQPQLARGETAEDDALDKDIPRREDPGIQSAFEIITVDSESISDYENSQDFQQAGTEAQSSGHGQSADHKGSPPHEMWVIGQRSIYVDAFNLALEAVLVEESHLFDTREMTVFDVWKGLGYEAQYLYVRLFLRKSATWHRTNRLGYYSDIARPDAAIATLQAVQPLPNAEPPRPSQQEDAPEEQDIMFGDTFTFADDSTACIYSVDEAAGLLSLDELKVLAKEAKVGGKNKGDLLKAFCKMSNCQTDLMALGLKRTTSEDSDIYFVDDAPPLRLERQDSTMRARHLDKILKITGPCIRLSEPVYRLFERVHLVFYRSTEWTEKSLTTIILAKMSRRNFPEYIVDRSSNIFPTRQHLIEYEAAMRLESRVDSLIEGPTAGAEERFRAVIEIFEQVYPRWKKLLRQEEQKEQSYEFGEGNYLRRFNAAHSYTRIVHKAAYVYGRLKQHLREHELLAELLCQRLFHHGRRGGWYQRKALLEENYMASVHPEQPILPKSNKSQTADMEQRKKFWRCRAKETCERGLQDRDCHLIYHYDLQKRLVKLEKALKIPRREQHDFRHVRLAKAEEHVVQGIQVKSLSAENMVKKPGMPSTKTVWVDEAAASASANADGRTERHCSVEEMCLTYYRRERWKGYHSEGGILRTLFAYLFFDVLFMYVPNVFQTAFQAAPLDLYTDGFYPARAGEIERRLAEISNGAAERIIRAVDGQHRERRTAVVGLNWDFDVEDLVELVGCFGGGALAAVCKVLAQEYRERGGGVPDLVLWRVRQKSSRKELMFVEVKSANDRLSDTQRLWIHVLTGAGVRVARASAIAKEVREVD